jgi:hypothetical protein
MKKLGHSFIIAVLMIASFICGKFFTEMQKIEKKSEEPPRVFIEQLKTKMNISKNHNDIEIFLNGERMTQDIKIDVKR